MNARGDSSGGKDADFAKSIVRMVVGVFTATPAVAYLALIEWAKVVMQTFEERQRVLRRPPSLKEVLQTMDEVTAEVVGVTSSIARGAESILAETMEGTARTPDGTGQRVSGNKPISRDDLRKLLGLLLGKTMEAVPSRYRGLAEQRTAGLFARKGEERAKPEAEERHELASKAPRALPLGVLMEEIIAWEFERAFEDSGLKGDARVGDLDWDAAFGQIWDSLKDQIKDWSPEAQAVVRRELSELGN